MFEVGNAIIYSTHGVCIISDITEMKFSGKKMNYYVLRPVYDPNSTFYAPTDNAALLSKMRLVLSKEEINNLIDQIIEEPLEWISDDEKRKEYCSSVIEKGDRRELLGIIGMLWRKQEELRQQKKHIHLTDEKFLKEAEKILHDEFSYVLEIERNSVPDYIVSRLSEKTE